MNNRYIGALVLAPILIFLFLGGEPLKYLLLVASVMGLYEFYSVVSKKGIKPFKVVGYVAAIIYYLTLNNITFEQVAIILFLVTMVLMCIPAIKPEYNYIDVAVTVLGFIYVAVFFSFISKISYKEGGRFLLWLVFLASWGCDTVAYYSGRLFGKHKLCPKVSPKKTIEGSIGGLLGAVIFCLVFGIIIKDYVNIPLYHYVIMAAIAGVFSQFGDLAASSIKRYSEVKDYSHLIPGHGGILDRFDSILFSAVVIFYYLTYIICI